MVPGFWLNKGDDSGTAKFNGGEISHNIAGENNADGKGGAVFSERVPVEFGQIIIEDNEASCWGGGILTFATTLAMDGTTLKNNYAVMGGGAYLQSTDTDIKNAIFEGMNLGELPAD